MSIRYFEGSFRAAHPTGHVMSYSCKTAVFNPSPEDVRITESLERWTQRQTNTFDGNFMSARGSLGGGQRQTNMFDGNLMSARGSLAGQRQPRQTGKIHMYHDDRIDDTESYFGDEELLSRRRAHEPRYAGSYAGYAPTPPTAPSSVMSPPFSSSSRHPRSTQKAIEYRPSPSVTSSSKKSSKPAFAAPPFDDLRFADEYESFPLARPQRQKGQRSASQYFVARSAKSVARSPSPERGRSRVRRCDRLLAGGAGRGGAGMRQIAEDDGEEDLWHAGGQGQPWLGAPQYQTVDITPYHLAPSASGYDYVSDYDSDR